MTASAPTLRWRLRRLLLPSLIGLTVFAAYIFTAPNDLWGNGDTYLRYQTTQAIVDHGVIHYVSSTAEHSPKWNDKRSAIGSGGFLYTIYAPGQIFAMAPLYLVGKVMAHHFGGSYVTTPLYTTHILDDIFGALLAVVFFLLALRLGYTRKIATILTLLFAFATVAWPDAESMLEHTQVTFFLCLSVLLALMFVERGLRNRLWIAGSGLAIGCAFLSRYDTGVLLWTIPAYVALIRLSTGRSMIHAVDPVASGTSRRTALRLARTVRTDWVAWRAVGGDWLVFGLSVLPAVTAAAAWNHARFGSFTKTGIPPTFGEPIWRGFAGLVLSPGKGLIWYMPVLFVLPFVVTAFWRQHRLITVFFAAIVVTELLLFCNVIYWHGDPAWGPRYIYATVPFLVLPLGIVLERWALISNWVKSAFVSVVAVSLMIQVVGVLTPQYRFWYKEIHTQLATREGFNWGSKDGHFWYYYYWDLSRNPILMSFQNLYEVTALRIFDQGQYRLWASPIPANQHLNFYNPEHTYEINNFNLWWLAARDPLFSTTVDAVVAAGWLLLAAGGFFLMRRELADPPARDEFSVLRLRRQPA